MTKPTRRWFQFSIRSLLILMFGVAAYLGGFVTSQRLAEKALREAEEKAAAELEAARAVSELQRVQASITTGWNSTVIGWNSGTIGWNSDTGVWDPAAIGLQYLAEPAKPATTGP
jgi:hypothetical protein